MMERKGTRVTVFSVRHGKLLDLIRISRSALKWFYLCEGYHALPCYNVTLPLESDLL